MQETKIDGLKPGTKYVVQIRAFDGDSYIDSAVLSFETPNSFYETINKTSTIKLGGGAIYAGDLLGPGVLFNQNGLGGIKSGGETSFFISASSGDAYFAGSITAGAGNIGGFRIGPTSLSATNIVISSTDGFNLGTNKFTVSTAGKMIAQEASITGSVVAGAGNIGGWKIDETQISANNAYINSQYGYIQVGTAAPNVAVMHNNYGFYAGAALADSSTPFWVNLDGKLIAQNASITGNINATSGSFTGKITANTGQIGGFSIQGNSLSATNIVLDSNTGFDLGAGQFTVSTTGALLALKADIRGRITASAGTIGGWNIDRTTLYSGTGASAVAISTNGTPKIYAGLGNHGDINTGFYLDGASRFSLGNQLIFNPARGATSASMFNVSFTLNSTSISLDNSSSFIKQDMMVTSSLLPVSTYVASAAVGNPAVIIFNASALATGTASATFLMDDFADLTITGVIRGKVENIQSISEPRLFSIFRSATIDTSASIISFTTDGHAFVQNEKIIFDGISSGAGNGLSALNYAASAGNGFVIQTASNSINFSISYGGYGTAGLTSGTVTASGNSSVQELTLGFHPAEKGSNAVHTSGVGIRLDKYNWWFTNNQFRVGTQGSYFSWNGSRFLITGGGSKQIQFKVGDQNSSNIISIVNSGNTPTYNNASTPFYVDGSGQFSLGRRLTFDPVSELLTIRGSGSFTGGIYSASITGGYFETTPIADVIAGAAEGATSLQPGQAANDVNSNITTISGGKIATGQIQSTGYSYTSGNFSSLGTQINLDNGAITSKNFAISSLGTASFVGGIYGASISGGILNITSNASIGGYIYATSGSFTGTIYAQSGSFTGAINSTASITGGVIKTSNPGVALYGGSRNYIGFTDNNGIDRGFITSGYVPYLGTNSGVVISGTYDTANSAPSYPYIAVGARTYDYKSIFLSSGSSGNTFLIYNNKYSELYLSSNGYGGLQDANGNSIYTAWDRIYISGGKTSVTASVMINSGYIPGTWAPSYYDNGGPVYINQTGSATTFIHSQLAASAGLTTTNHPLQIGPDSSRNLRIDSNGIQAVNNSAVGSLFINKLGGSATLGGQTYFSNIRTAGRTTSVTEKIEGFFATDSYSSLIRDINGLNASSTPLYLGVYNSGGAISGTTMITRFLVEGNYVGSINVNSTGTTPAFAGFSDYRLKENISDFNFASDIIKKIKLRSFKWKNNNTYDVGFIAHELQDASLDLAMGNKDDVDENGNPIYQSTMPARLIPYLTGALKDAILKIEELEQRIAVLENK